MTHDDIRKALTVLGYNYPYSSVAFFPDPNRPTHGPVEWHDVGGKDPIPLDLASLLRRCRERGLQPELTTMAIGGVEHFVAMAWADELPTSGRHPTDPTTALILALAAMGQKENGNG